MNAQQMLQWMTNAQPGASVIYYEGFMAQNRNPLTTPGKYVGELSAVVMAANHIGCVSPVQKRTKEGTNTKSGEFLYTAQRTAEPWDADAFQKALHRKSWFKSTQNLTKALDGRERGVR